jgi:hypothetical protein
MASSASAVALSWRLSGSAASQSAYSDCSVNNVPTASRQRWGRLRRSVGRRGRVTGRSRFHLLAGAIARAWRSALLSACSPVAPVGHSLFFAIGAWPPHDGVRRTRCLNLSRDLEASLPAGSGLSTRSPRPSSPRERRDSAFVRRKLELLSSCGYRHCGLFAPTELAAIGPYTVQDYRQLAGDRYACARHAAALGNVHPPSPQSRPFGATDQQRMGCLVQRG